MEDEVRARVATLVDEPFELSRRDTRWLALGTEVVAFAARCDDEWRRLEAERWLIGRWRAAGVPAPRVIDEDATRGVQVRERLHGLFGAQIHTSTGHSPLYARVLDSGDWIEDAPLSPFGERVATSYGELAARIRRAVSVEDASAAGLGTTSRRDVDLDDILARLDATDASSATKAAARRARSWLEALPPPDAVIHGDLHFFNMVTADDGTITGVFDFGDAGVDSAPTELLYVHSLGPQFVAQVVEAYGETDLDEVRRAHARVALGHLIWHPPGTERHPQIVAWIAAVLERLV
jgi:aminoglycoside phosphotransferase